MQVLAAEARAEQAARQDTAINSLQIITQFFLSFLTFRDVHAIIAEAVADLRRARFVAQAAICNNIG